MPSTAASTSLRLRSNSCAAPNGNAAVGGIVTETGRIAWASHSGSQPARTPTETELLAWIEELCL